jgi:hypothetical protein
VEGFGERRDESGQLDRRVRTGPLPNHVDSLSRVAPAVRKAFLTRPHLKFLQAATGPAVMATRDERDPSAGAGRLAECPELATGTVLHVHHSPV